MAFVLLNTKKPPEEISSLLCDENQEASAAGLRAVLIKPMACHDSFTPQDDSTDKGSL